MGATQELDWKLDQVGRWGEPVRHTPTAEQIRAYAEATNDEHPLHRSGELAPPVFAVVNTMIEALGPQMGALVPPEVAMRVVHGEQDFRYHQPIRPGMELVTRGAVVGVHGASSGVVVLSKGVTETATGDPVVEQYMSAFYRGARLDAHVGEPLTDHRFDAALRDRKPDAQVTHGYDADQTRRYSRASGDPMPIHLDEQFARSVGLPGIIVHGLCTMAFCGRAVVQSFCPEDPTRLKRFAVRFSHIVQPHEKVTHSLWRARAGEIKFESTTDNGNRAIKDGLAQIIGG